MLTNVGTSLRRLFSTDTATAEPFWLRALASLVAGLAIASMVLFCAVAFRRAGYPFELEWIEGEGREA